MANLPKYIITAFYCEVCKKWHYYNEPEFHECIDKYNAHFSFKATKTEPLTIKEKIKWIKNGEYTKDTLISSLGLKVSPVVDYAV